ncbi:SBBP repeat-containing protein [Dyadobacter sp. CY261]|uniref:SBBP repeat-containing protein n=1 Tax=Dyadobacter sp. CY261 TaxID=2907203 RepID=UPI001F1E6E9D|nr:SBBP repeat-containing protein [Dyadobacter sp. CY261]MCF0069547.1 SBBP repeat-containing protein [Dyadobacter sp. CY261]
MKPLYLFLLCLGLWQCRNPDNHDIPPVPGGIDKNGDSISKAAPFIITAGNAIGWDVALDSDSNIYVTGSFYGTTAFGETPQTSTGNIDVFIAKYNAEGVFQWIRSIGNTGYDEGRGIAVDSSGDVYVAGDYYGTVSAGNMSVTSVGDADVFVAKYNTNGEAQWIRSVGSAGGERGHDLALDANGNVYVTGEFQGTGKFETTIKQAAGEFDVFVLKYNTDGLFQWVQTAGGSQRETGYGIAADAISGDVYVTGAYFGTTTFGNINKTSAGDADVFFAKYSSDGALQWMQSAGESDADVGRDVAIDGLGNIYVTGQSGSSEGFLTKYTRDGGLQWGQSLKFNSQGSGVSTDDHGNAYVLGFDSAISKYNSDGVLQRAQFPRSTDYVSGWGIAATKSGKLYITGFYKGTITFGATSKTAASAMDMFVIGGDL